MLMTEKKYKFWFCTGSQDLYGDECLAHVAKHSQIIVEELNKSGRLPFELVWKPTLITNEVIRKTFNEANQDPECAGVITWMHTFSPAKSWILGLQEYHKPLCHLHTQFNQEIPYESIDMDFMNENQSAHGGREYGHIVTRMGIERKVIVGHWAHVAVQAQIELGFERFLDANNYQAIVTHFGDLGGLKQLPGLAIQRLMEKGYGFGAEGDWKTAAMVRLMKIMAAGTKDAKGTSFFEDYTYNLVKGREGILQAHMLEVCPTIADGKISIKECPLSMGNREDPARLVFTAKEGHGIATSLIDLGDRFRLIINDVEVKKAEKPMPKLPVATAFWTPEPSLETGAAAWIYAGGAHHTAFSYDLTAEQMGDWANAMGIETVYIDKDTNIRQLRNELRWNEAYYKFH